MPTYINSSGAICTTGLISAQDLTDIANFYRNTFDVQFSPVAQQSLATAADFNNLRAAILNGAGVAYLAEIPNQVTSGGTLIAATTWKAPTALSFNIPKTATTIGTTVFSGPEGTNMIEIGSTGIFFPFKGDTTSAFTEYVTQNVAITQASYRTVNEWEPDTDVISQLNAFKATYQNNPPDGYSNISFSESGEGAGPAKINSHGTLVNEWVTTTVTVYGDKRVPQTSYQTTQGDTVTVSISSNGTVSILINYKDSWPGRATDGISINSDFPQYSSFIVNGKLQVTIHFLAHI